MRLPVIISTITLCVCAATLFAADLGDGSDKSARRLDLLKRNFDSALREARCPYGILCVVENGRTVMLEVGGIPKVEQARDIRQRALTKALPLGGSTSSITSFAAVNMLSDGKLNLAWRVTERFSAFKAPHGTEKYATFENLLNMRAGFCVEESKKLPKDSTPLQVLEFIGKTYANGNQEGRGEYSPLCAAAVGYALGYETDKSEKNFKKSYTAFLKKYFFDKVGIAEPKYRAYDTPLFPSLAVALAPSECAKWLETETRAPTDSLLAQRRISPSGSRYAMGWRDSSIAGLPAQITASVFQNCANEIAIFPLQKTALAVFVVGEAKPSRKVCLQISEFFGQILADSKISPAEKIYKR